MKGRKTGGRKKGTPNKVSASIKEQIEVVLTQYSDSGQMTRDFDELEPRERLLIAEKLMGYVMPKMKSVEMDVHASSDVRVTTIERLRELAGETGEHDA